MGQVGRDVLRDSDADASWPEASNGLADLLADRFSCRGYRPDPVPKAVIRRMLSIAQLSASWCNSQPWEVIVTAGQGTERFRRTLFDHATADHLANQGVPRMAPDFPFPAGYHGIFKERQREVGWQLFESVGVAYGDRAASARQSLENFRLFGAPHMLLVTSERDLGIYGAIDCGFYMANLLLAAQSLGLGTIPQAALAVYAPLVRQHFEIPDNRAIIAGMSFGYADNAHPANSFRSRRADPDDVVRWVIE